MRPGNPVQKFYLTVGNGRVFLFQMTCIHCEDIKAYSFLSAASAENGQGAGENAVKNPGVPRKQKIDHSFSSFLYSMYERSDWAAR